MRKTIGCASLIATLAIVGCSGSTSTVSSPATSMLPHGATSGLLTEYVYVADRTQEKLFVYPARTANPSPVRTVTTGLVEVGGIATDSNGNLYVANGSAGNVIEFAPGATSVLRTFSSGLHHPANVAVGSDGTVYVADQNTPSSAIVVYPSTGVTPSRTILTPNGSSAPPRGVAVDSSGNLFISESGIGDFWPPPTGACEAIVEGYEYPAGGTGWTNIFLSRNEQAWGLALDSAANLYASDFCLNGIRIYAPPSYGYSSSVTGVTLNEPIYQTISSDRLLAIPNGGEGTSGYVTVKDLTGVSPPVTITNSLQGPIGSAVGFGP